MKFGCSLYWFDQIPSVNSGGVRTAKLSVVMALLLWHTGVGVSWQGNVWPGSEMLASR